MKTKLNRKIYTKVGITEACEAFEHLCSVKVQLVGEYYQLLFENVDDTVKDVLPDEFANYALYATISGRK